MKYRSSKNCHAQDPSLWSRLSCKTQPLRTAVTIPYSHFERYTEWPYWNSHSMTVRICRDAEEKILQQNAFAYDKWSCLWLHQMFTYIKNCFTSKLNNKSIVKWLPNSPPHLKHVATLPCDLLLITIHVSNFRYFPTRMFHKVVQCKAVTGLATFSARIVIYLMLIRRAGT